MGGISIAFGLRYVLPSLFQTPKNTQIWCAVNYYILNIKKV